MGLTLFGYIFRDLVRVFLLAAVALAGVLSFAGLLRPLTEQGLGAGQAATILAWLLPAMLVYSLPIAALFATTFVYGRLAADNESVGAKAAGISAGPFGLLLPALVLGGLLGLGTIGLLGILVPAANLQVEKTIWTNLARLTANQINRSNRASFQSDAGAITVFADRAVLPDADTIEELVAQSDVEGDGASTALTSLSPNVQLVRLENAYVVRYPDEKRRRGGRLPAQVPEEIYAARAATIFIEPPVERGKSTFEQTSLSRQEFVIYVVLEDGVKFPRSVGVVGRPATAEGESPLVAAASTARFGPVRRDVPVRINSKFMSVEELRRLIGQPDQSQRIRDMVHRQVVLDKRAAFLTTLARDAAVDGAEIAGEGRVFTLTSDAVGRIEDLTLVYDGTPVIFRQQRPLPDGTTETLEVWSDSATVNAEPLVPFSDASASLDDSPFLVTFRLDDAAVTIDGETTINRDIERRVVIPAPDWTIDFAGLTAADYLDDTSVAIGAGRMSSGDKRALIKRLTMQNGDVVGELHARGAFIVACLMLPMVGAAMGLLTRSGNFLVAFALSTIPAAVCIAMILFGQQLASEVGPITDADLERPGDMMPSAARLAVIWSGDAVVAIGGALLVWRVRRR
ncbi:MAG: LptF/LptG family permease [Planctomycetota bacterium]